MLKIWRFAAIVKLLLCSIGLAAPNVVVILTDDQGYGDLSCHGNPQLKTPNLDAFRGESTSMDRFMVSPTCSPTRAALMTGRHEFLSGVSHTNSGRSLLRPGPAILPEIMRDAGYATGIFGKWHLGESYPCRPEDRGFEEVFVHGGGGIGQTPDYWGNGYFDPMIRRKSGWVATDGYCTDVFFREAEQWMKEQVAEERPFFLWLATNAPHAPHVAPKGKAEAHRDKGLEEPAASFYAMIENIDENVGRLLAEIESLGIEDETIVVFMTDNGSALGLWNAGMRGKKGEPHEGGVRVPCFIRWPGKVGADRLVEELSGHVDLLPTLTGLCRIPLPEDWSGDGEDLSACLLGEKAFPSGRRFFTHVGRWHGDDGPERHRATKFSVRDDRWRLVGLDLFDMKADPGETTTVFGDHAEVAQGLLLDYGRWWDSVLPILRLPVRYVIGGEQSPSIELTAHDWWPSREQEASNQRGVGHQKGLRDFLTKARVAKTRNSLAGTSGHWKLWAERSGRYRIRMSLVPPGAPAEDLRTLAKLRAGTAHVRVGQEEVKMEVRAGATLVTMMMDLPEGALELEAWFEGQLLQERKLGAFFVTIERIGERELVMPEIRVKPAE